MSSSVRYFQRELGGIVRLTNGVVVHCLNLEGEWEPNQYLITMFIDGMENYKEIKEECVLNIIAERKNMACKGKCR